MHLCDEGACGLRRPTAIINRQILLLRKNGPKKEGEQTDKSNIVKSLSEGCSGLEISKTLGRDPRTIKCFVAKGQQGQEEKMQINCKDLRRIKHEATRKPRSIQCCHIPPLKDEVFGSQRHGRGEGG